MRLGYASGFAEQRLMAPQIQALNNAQCDRLVTDAEVLGTPLGAIRLRGAFAMLVPGDTLVVWRLDRLADTLSVAVHLIDGLLDRRVHVISLTECIDTRSPLGMLAFHMIAALAQCERT